MMMHEDLHHRPSTPPRKIGLQIFLSYASEQQRMAEEIALALKERGHRVFFDRDRLSPGEGFHVTIEQEVRACQLAIFLISPEAVKAGTYALTELGYISQRFEHPHGHVLPVLIAPTPLDSIPSYLQAVTLLRPKGNPAAEVAAAVDRLCPPHSMQIPTNNQPEQYTPVTDRQSKTRKVLVLAQHPYSAAVGFILVVTGNLLNYAGNEGSILHVIYDRVGIDALKKIDLFVRPSTLVILFLGYSLMALWLSVWARSNLRLARPLSMSIAILAFASNVTFGVPDEPELQGLLDHKFADRLSSWTERVLSYQDSATGGIRGAPDYRAPSNPWTTAQVLVGALSAAEVNPHIEDHAPQIKSAMMYLQRTRAAEPQIGWGYYENPEHTITEISSWATLAYLLALESDMKEAIWSQEEMPDVISEVEESLNTIVERQHRSGGWIPIEGSLDEADTRTYSTVMALWVLLEATQSSALPMQMRSSYEARIKDGITWLLQNYDEHFGWVPNPNRAGQNEVFIGLSAQAVYVLVRAARQYPIVKEQPNYRASQRWILTRHIRYNDIEEKNLQGNRRTHDADVHLVGVRFLLEQSTFLWFPWSYSTLSMLVADAGLSENERWVARDARLKMSLRFQELDAYLEQEFPYVLAENLFAISSGLRWASPGYRVGWDQAFLQ